MMMVMKYLKASLALKLVTFLLLSLKKIKSELERSRSFAGVGALDISPASQS